MIHPVLPLLLAHAPGEQLAWWQGRSVDREGFLAHVQQIAGELPRRRHAINLCEDRYLFMVSFAAVMVRTQTNLLPANRTSKEIQAMMSDYPDSYCLWDDDIKDRLAETGTGHGHPVPQLAADQVAAIAFTSGSTGRARPNPKRWGGLVTGAQLANQRFGIARHAGGTLVATVPAQHMYGLETSVLLPLVCGIGVYGARPFFPEDIRAALEVVPAPRILITTPAHLWVCVEAGIRWPEVVFIISATAPLGRPLAERAEQVFGAPVLEIYGCTEAGSIASRRTVDGDLWTTYDGVTVDEREGIFYVCGGHLPEPVALNDVLTLYNDRQFVLLGRQADLVNIAGKRASLADLNRKLNEILGVQDGVFIFLNNESDRINRLMALVVAPKLSERQVLAALAERIDPVFLPRPLYKVVSLPRNETGKLPKEAVLALLERLKGGAS